MAAEIMTQIVERQGERVHGIHHELHFRFLLVTARLGQPQPGRANGVALIATAARTGPPASLLTEALQARRVLPQDAAEHLLPVLAEPRIPPIVLRGARCHVFVETGDPLRLQLDGDGPLGFLFKTLHQLTLPAPAVAG